MHLRGNLAFQSPPVFLLSLYKCIFRGIRKATSSIVVEHQASEEELILGDIVIAAAASAPNSEDIFWYATDYTISIEIFSYLPRYPNPENSVRICINMSLQYQASIGTNIDC